MRVKSRRPSGTSAIPWRHTRWARHAAEIDAVEAQRARPRALEPGDRVDERGLARAVGADHRDDLAVADLERGVPDRGGVAVGDRQSARASSNMGLAQVDLDTRGSRMASRGRPAAITSPSFRTTTRSDSSSTARMRCSTKTMLTPRARISRISRMALAISPG